MRLPVVLFALAAFLIGSVTADTRPVPSPPSCTGANQKNAGCFCQNGCTDPNTAAWFSCYLSTTSQPISDIGIRFEAGYAQPSQTRSWQISNTANWPTGLAVDLYQPATTFGSDPFAPGPTPSYAGNTDQWYTSGVVQLGAGNPTGPNMWACTKDNLLLRSSNNGYGPAQPRCYNPATSVFSAPYSQGCQEALLFDPPANGGTQYRGWGYSGLKARLYNGGTYPTPDGPTLQLIPSTPLTATELRPLPTSGGSGAYSAGGIQMNCYVSLFDPCARVTSTCPGGYVCVDSTFNTGSPNQGSIGTCPTDKCCPPGSIIRPPNGGEWYCCPSGQVIKTRGSLTNCCLSSEELDVNGACCPSVRLQANGQCCPTTRFDPSQPNQCCAYDVSLTGGDCCPGGSAGPYVTITNNNIDFQNTEPNCCPAANANDGTGNTLACCPATVTNGRLVDIVLTGTTPRDQYCCPATQVITSNVPGSTNGQKVCCPATGGPFTFTTNLGGNLCCPNTRLAGCTASQTTTPLCCPSSGGPFTCIGATSAAADFNPCCPNSDVTPALAPVGGGTALPRCCPNYVAGVGLTWFGLNQCCVTSYVIDVTNYFGSSFSAPAPQANFPGNKYCCPDGFNAQSDVPAGTFVFGCSSISSSGVCTWTTGSSASACCASNRIASIGPIQANRANTICCPNSGPYATCSSTSTCPRDRNSGNVNPCCPASSTITTCPGPAGTGDQGLSFCCPNSGVACTNAGGTSTATRRCCPTNQIPLIDNNPNNLADYCCPNANQANNPNVYLDAANPCCPLNNVGRDPDTNQPNFAANLCCPTAGSVIIGGVCCPSAQAVRNPANNQWVCCPSNFNPPTIIAGSCCDDDHVFNDAYCCPSYAGRPSLQGATFCPATPNPPTQTNCWVNNADCSIFNFGPATGCCCHASALARQILNGPALPTVIPCCASGSTSTIYYFLGTSNNDECCPASQATSYYRANPTAADTARCCPAAAAPLVSGGNPVVVAGVTCSYYTTINDGSGNAVTCCRNCDVSREYAGGGTVVSTSANARCCPNSGSTPTVVDAIANGVSSSNRYCCPRANVASIGGQLYCCPQSTSIFPVASFINGVCCPPNADVTDLNTNAPTCCPNYDTTKGTPVWADFGGGLSGNCCPPNQILSFSPGVLPSGAPTPNLPATNASSAPSSSTRHRFCCPLSQISAGTLPPPADAFFPALDPAANSGSFNPTNFFNTPYTNYKCCPAGNILRVQAPNGKVYDVCCPGPNMIWNKDTGQCCAAGVIAPPCPVPTPLTGCSGSCCPAGETGAIAVPSANNPPTATVQSCCPTTRVESWLGVNYCCPTPTSSYNPTPSYNNAGQLLPCCNLADTLDCTIAACNDSTPPYKKCCPVSVYPIPASVAGNTPPPPLIIDPQTGDCCRGYLNTAGPTLPGGNTCCVPRPGVTVYRQATDDPCCTTLIQADGTCCPIAAYHGGANPVCCSASEAWAIVDNKCCPIALATGRQPDGTYTDCCDDPGFTNDPGQTCCPTSQLQNGYCCPPDQLDSFGHCCANASSPLDNYVDTSSGGPIFQENVTYCCDSGLVDCAGVCYYLDPVDGVVKPYFVFGANGTGCCPESLLDCAGQCPPPQPGSSLPFGPNYGPPRNNGTTTDCCPDELRGCLNGQPNMGLCGAADTNCCEQYSGSNCTTCISNPRCGWCNAIGSSEGLCLSGDYIGPNAGIEGVICNQTGGYRWVATGESKIFNSFNNWADGRNIESANVSVLLAENEPLVVPFRIRAPADLPLDLYILQDRTNSFIQPVVVGSTYLQYGPLDVLKSNLAVLDAAIDALVPSGYHLGFGTFGDKAVEPFGYWENSGWFDFVYSNVYQVDFPRTAALNAIQNLDPNTFAGGYDIPESSMEALLHVAQNPVVNWGNTRADSTGRQVPVNKIVVVVTDAPAHVASTNWAGYAAGARFPNTDFPPAASGAPRDLSYYLSSDPTVQSLRLALNPVDSWKANSGSYLDTDCLPTDPASARIRSPAQAFNANRQGVCTDYPTAQQTATALFGRGVTCVFAVADTISQDTVTYPLTAAYDFWSNFATADLPAEGNPAGLVVRLNYSVSPTGPGGLVYTIQEAIKNITQSITFENTTSSIFLTNGVQVSFNLPPSGSTTVPVTLVWDGSDLGSSGPFPIDFQAIFPLSGYVIDVARINVYITPEKRCCFCGDGVVQNETGCDEQCDNDGSTDSVCCEACKIDVGQICSNDNLCVPVICAADGLCAPNNIQDSCINDILDPLAFCQFNTCLAGACVVTCNSDACCNDNDNCTNDICNDLSLCQYTLLDVCDCSNSAFNNCFDCVRNNNTRCGYEVNSGTCFQFNETIYEQGGYGSGINVVDDEDGITQFCIVGRDRNGNTGVIVGAVVGALAALGLIALAAALWWRLRNGPLLQPGGAANTAGNSGAAQANPTYVHMSGQTNPLHGGGP